MTETPSVDPYKIQTEIRLMAFETVIVHIAKVVFLTAGVSDETIAEWRANAAQKLEAETIPGVDPSWSDHCAAEVDKLIAKIQSTVANARSQLSRGSGLG